MDPHAVYVRIFPDLDVSDRKIVRRGLMRITSGYLTIRYIFMVAGHFPLMFDLIKYRGRKIFISEGSLVVFYAMVLPFVILLKIKGITFNVNHNFNSSLERLAARRIAPYLDVGFIEPSEDFLRRYPFITPIRIVPDQRARQPLRRIYVFLGQRPEQFEVGREEFIGALAADLGDEIDVIGVGAAPGRRLSDQEFSDVFSPASAIVLLYNMEKYAERHSGIVLEAIARNTTVFLRRSELSAHYRSRGFCVHEFDGVQDVTAVLTSKNS